jgi:hypothetical protein
MAKTSIPTGKKFDDFQISMLAEVFLTHRKELADYNQMEIVFRKLHEKFMEGVKKNVFYRKTPRVFASLTIFYVQTAVAYRRVFSNFSDDEQLLQYLYRNTVCMNPAIGSCPDVSMSEAKRILKMKL